LYRGAVANAFHDVRQAERILRSIMRAAPRSDSAYEAHKILSRLYLRTGQYRRLTADLDERSALFPNKTDLQEDRREVAPFLGLPDQEVGLLHRASLHHDRKVFVPVTINGGAAKYFFDTGAWVSCMTESEATRLGLTVHDAVGRLGTSAGASLGLRTAVAARLTVGTIEFSNVSFAVFRDDQEPWSQLARGERGIIGIPILLGLGALQWIEDGTLEIGPAGARTASTTPNLFFDDNHLVTLAGVGGREVLATLDTGAETTDLYGRFATAFAGAIKEQGQSGSTDVRGVGHAERLDSVTLPELTFRLGGTDVLLRPAHVILKDMGASCCVGNVGLDLLTQTHAFTIDFTAMRLELGASGR
jgi:predicted aspartyl protease